MNSLLPVRYLGLGDIRELAERLEVRPTKRLGQNFVHDPGTIRRIVAAAGLRPQDSVLEIGPGLGSLTLGLLDVAHDVTAVEVDGKLADALSSTIAARAPGRQFHLVEKDALGLTGADLPAAPTALVANLPYNVAVPVFLRALAELPSIDNALVMVQLEVGQRLAAKPGAREGGVPTLKTAFYGHAELAGKISPEVFWPQPNVDSALVRFTRRADSPWATDEHTRRAVFALIDAAFASRRKTLGAVLKGWAGSPEELRRRLEAAGVPGSARGEELHIGQFVALASA
ncbi:dimethyladenosine transferase [Segniliparus rotundus DSM 44985]|uniref:Ribosomal RNA small subunit methyltransferase A n=1 Tax=Segniliparus rotundus (strain ATCC BAA-972 / CDC 1076 / CIP 108378 / DSM 44985 / JCM 13578) TaxID=640132 RepID=D6ZA18_SEGRD|nr:16S rRNA (adenine(1518)-N(6)/adenine(1519)-N(6))-dimethyltransferase RsmA [Segniliparus rotundus]ADG98688.1 dimethyladenosine transferase [Segniliparus rotundus DSM 44985]